MKIHSFPLFLVMVFGGTIVLPWFLGAQEKVSLYEEMVDQHLITKTLIQPDMLEKLNLRPENVLWVKVQDISSQNLRFQVFTGSQKSPESQKNYPFTRNAIFDHEGKILTPEGTFLPLTSGLSKIKPGEVIGIVFMGKGIRYILLPHSREEKAILEELHDALQHIQ